MKFRNKELINDENGTWIKNVEGLPLRSKRDEKNRVIRSEDGYGNWEVTTYDTRGYIVLQEGVYRKKHYYRFTERDSNGNMIFQKCNNIITTYTYTKDNKPKTMESSNGCWYNKEYDSNGNMILHEWADSERHVKCVYIYDKQNRTVYDDYEVIGVGKTWTAYEYGSDNSTNIRRLIHSNGTIMDHSKAPSVSMHVGLSDVELLKETLIAS